MRRPLLVAVITLIACTFASRASADTPLAVSSATGPSPGGADVHYFGMLLYVDADIPPNCPAVTAFQITLGPPLTVAGVVDGTTPIPYTHAVAAAVDYTAGWTNNQISDDAVFPAVPPGSSLSLCTYPLDATFAKLSECDIGNDSGSATATGTVELSGYSSCTTQQNGAVVGAGALNNSPILTVLSEDLSACSDGIDFAFTDIQIQDPDGDDISLTVNVVSAPVGAVVTPLGPLSNPSGSTLSVTVRGPNPGTVELEYLLTDAAGLAGTPHGVTVTLNDCPGSG